MAKQAAESKSRLRFDLFALKPGEQVVSKFDELAAYPAFVKHGSGANDCWARFAVLYADAGSEYRDLAIDLKRDRCMAAAGVPKDDARRAAVLAGTDQPALELIADYIRLQDWLEYATIFHGREHVWAILAKLSKPLDTGMDTEKEQKAIGNKNSSLEFALETVGELDRRWLALWQNDLDVKTNAQQQQQKGKLTGEARAEGRKFIPPATR